MSKIINLFSRNEEVLERMDVNNFRVEIVRPALQLCGLWSKSAENLLIGTALAESNLNWVTQIGGGEGLSFFQIESDTYNDVVRYLFRSDNKKLKDRILAACMMEIFPEAKCLVWNIRLAVLIARLVYWRKSEPLPEKEDYEGMANYHKKHYNTYLGKTDVSESIKIFKMVIDGSRWNKTGKPDNFRKA